jgi:hypothetical protein
MTESNTQQTPSKHPANTLTEVKLSQNIHHTVCSGCRYESFEVEGIEVTDCPVVSVEGESALECTHNLIDGRLKARNPKPWHTFIFMPEKENAE